MQTLDFSGWSQVTSWLGARVNHATWPHERGDDKHTRRFISPCGKMIARKRTIAPTAVAVLGISAAAFAYWTTTGSGTGSATNATSNAVTIAQTSTRPAMRPGSPPQTLNFTATNGTTENQHISTVTVSISSDTAPNITADTPCAAGNHTIVQPTASNAHLTPGVHSYAPAGASLQLTNSATNQDACKNATVNLAYAAA